MSRTPLQVLWRRMGNRKPEKQPMQDCIACYQCRQKGKCVFDDQVNEMLPV